MFSAASAGYPSKDVAEFPRLGVHDGVVGASDLVDLRARAHGHHPALHLLGAGAVGIGHHEHLPDGPVVGGREQRRVLHQRVVHELVAGPHQQLRQGQVLRGALLVVLLLHIPWTHHDRCPLLPHAGDGHLLAVHEQPFGSIPSHELRSSQKMEFFFKKDLDIYICELKLETMAVVHPCMCVSREVCTTSSRVTPKCLPTHGSAAATNTAVATLLGNLSMASARLTPPWLWPTRTSLSPSGAAATASSSGRE
uniref:Uncharacterized protein n=1 Tax=Zea mays TaxID=4577 RepID=A0A804N811_MAIZE